MQSNKPSCEAFILAAIRKIRQNPQNLKEGTNAGVSLYKVWELTSQVYSESEFRDAINAMLERETVVVMWLISSKKADARRTSRKKVLAGNIPAEMVLDSRGWIRDAQGNTISCKDEENGYSVVCNAKIFICVDGLPQYVAKRLSSKKGELTALQIIAEMKRE